MTSQTSRVDKTLVPSNTRFGFSRLPVLDTGCIFDAYLTILKRSQLSRMDDLIKDGKNNKWVVCKFCESKVLRPSAASYEEREVK